MKLQAAPLSTEQLEKICINKENKDKIILLQDIGLNKVSCSRCNAWAHNHNEIVHKSCCPYVGGDGCYAGG